MPDLNSGDEIEVEGSKGNRYVLRRIGDVYSCTCPAWEHGQEPEKIRTCKHLKAYRGELAERARQKRTPTSPTFQGELLEDIFRADLLDQAETLLSQREGKRAYELVEQAHDAKKRGEAISLVADAMQRRWIEIHVTRCWKLRADVLAFLAQEDPSLQPIAEQTRQSIEKLQNYVKDTASPEERRKAFRIVRPGDEA